MTIDMELEKYKAVLTAVTPIFDQFFESQKDYIKCEMGCSNCCQKGYYPVTNAEAKLMKTGIEQLESSLKEKITQKAKELDEERNKFVEDGNDILKFKYACPFLENDLCSIYEYRPIICRTQGLITQSINSESKFNMPNCVHIGLNYANIWDDNISFFSEEKIKELNSQNPPLALDFSYESLIELCGTNPEGLDEKLRDIENDEIRMIFEWILR